MLPFNKRKKTEEFELGDADIVVLEEAPVEVDVAELQVAELAELDADNLVADESRPQLVRSSAPRVKVSTALRRLVTPRDRFETDVADECLKSIAAATATSRARLSDSFPASIVPPAPRLPSFDTSVDELLADAPLPQFELSDADETVRRPASSASLPIARDSVPGVRSFVPAPPSVSSLPTPVFSRTTSSSQLPAASSIAPVSMNSTPGPIEPTVILVRQPPKTGWVVAAAFLGAACALLGMRILTRSVDPPPTIVLATQAPPPAATVVEPTPGETAKPAAPAPAPPPPATVRFSENQGVAVIAAPTTTLSASTSPAAPKATAQIAAAPAPAKPAARPASLGPKLPDGSMALTKASPPQAAQPEAKPLQPEPAPAPAPAAGPKRRLTPEQELADAQLKASMR